MNNIAWIAADWGSSNLRVWGMGADNRILTHAHSADGMLNLRPDAYENALLALIDPWLDREKPDHPDGGQTQIPVLACGMVGARQGWVEAPYRNLPADPVAVEELTPAPVRDRRIRVHIVPGLCQRDPPDVLRGEETQIAGVLAANPSFRGVVCLPGTHGKWVRIADGRVVSFRTFMTGELFALLQHHSVLRHALSGAGLDRTVFTATVAAALRRPDRLSADLFAIRARHLLDNTGPAQVRAELSARLIAAEIHAGRQMFNPERICLIGDGEEGDGLGALYADAFRVAGIAVDSPDDLSPGGVNPVVSGLARIRAIADARLPRPA